MSEVRQTSEKEEIEKSKFAAKIIKEYEESGQPRPAFNVDALWAQKKEQEKIEAEESKRKESEKKETKRSK